MRTYTRQVETEGMGEGKGVPLPDRRASAYTSPETPEHRTAITGRIESPECETLQINIIDCG